MNQGKIRYLHKDLILGSKFENSPQKTGILSELTIGRLVFRLAVLKKFLFLPVRIENVESVHTVGEVFGVVLVDVDEVHLAVDVVETVGGNYDSSITVFHVLRKGKINVCVPR